ncbi:MAG: cell division protein FtsH, partial [SAR324 cluster bacterium]|nr:cell division protein FtsH [SAR324 cluster bacterium]
PVHKVTIVPRGQSLGLTSFLPQEEMHTQDRDYLLAKIMVAMGGRAAEELILSQVSTGAANDIQQATKIANKMVTEWGMSEVVGPITLSTGSEHHFLGRDIGIDREYSEDTADIIDMEVHEIVHSSYDKAKAILSEHIDKLHQLAKLLIDQETVEAAEVYALVSPT